MSTNRSNRRVIAKDTLECLKKGAFKTPEGSSISFSKAQKQALKQTKLYSPTATDALLETTPTPLFDTTYQVTTESTLEAVRRLLREGHTSIVALNFASAKHPGGGFLSGNQAQEESLVRSTGLYPCLLKAKEYYTVNRGIASAFYSDYMIYSPQVPLLKEDNGRYLSKLELASFITAPAVNKGAVKNNEPERLSEIAATMRQRTAKVLAVAQENGHQHLVLGAWGCGVFQNDPVDIAQCFHEVLEQEFKGVFETVVFAIYTKEERLIAPFKALFG